MASPEGAVGRVLRRTAEVAGTGAVAFGVVAVLKRRVEVGDYRRTMAAMPDYQQAELRRCLPPRFARRI